LPQCKSHEDLIRVETRQFGVWWGSKTSLLLPCLYPKTECFQEIGEDSESGENVYFKNNIEKKTIKNNFLNV